MARDLYYSLADKDLLKRAWHLARVDSTTDFIIDPFNYSDFGFHISEHIDGIALDLSRNRYHPKVPQTVDTPKSSLAVRPGAILDIEDKIVLFAIAYLIAPKLDKQLPDGVYSYRYKEGDKKKLFQDFDLVKYPFLKKHTILTYIPLVEPWYEAWPQFDVDSRRAYEQEGYRYLVISDVASYFENINITILSDILKRYFPKDQELINFLKYLLEYWALPAVHGSSAPQGMPQGNAVSSFLSNVYLLPLDEAVEKFSKRNDVKYFRYVDDIRIFTKDLSVAYKVLFLMNEKLRGIRLNIQASKTRILEGAEIEDELIDLRKDRVDELIKEFENKVISPSQRADYLRDLNQIRRQIGKKDRPLRGNDLRLFKRLITAYSQLRSTGLMRDVLAQFEINPDAAFVKRASRYIGVHCRNRKTATERLIVLLKSHTLLFPYQESFIYSSLRYMRNMPPDAFKEARRCLDRKSEPWFVKQQAILLLCQNTFTTRQLNSYTKLYENEHDPEVKRTMSQLLSQLPKEQLEEISYKMLFSTDPLIQRVGRFYCGLLKNEADGVKQVKSVLTEFVEERLLDRFYELEILSKSDSILVKRELQKYLKSAKRSIKRPLLRTRADSVLRRLAEELGS